MCAIHNLRRATYSHCCQLVDQGLVQMEGRSVGRVDRQTYRTYAKAWDALYVLPVLMLLLAGGERTCFGLQNWWLSVWSNNSATQVGCEPVWPTCTVATTDKCKVQDRCPVLTG